jgi:hypothetical protein
MDNIKLGTSPKSHNFDMIPLIEETYEKADPVILTDALNDMIFTKNIILVYQYPPSGKLFVPSYISADYQTHYAIYKLIDNKLTLCFQRQQIVFEGLVSYYINRDICNKLYDLGLNKTDIQKIMNNKYFLKT